MDAKRVFGALGIGAALLAGGGSVCAGVSTAAVFSQSTDTIYVPGHFNQSNTSLTVEAEVKVGAGSNYIFDEKQYAVMDTGFGISSTSIWGWVYPTPGGAEVAASYNFSPNTWYHVAFVVGGSQQRLYVNGQLVATAAANGSFATSGSSTVSIGGYQYYDFRPSFIGDMDWIRVSSNARYTGSSFTVPSEPTAGDSYTQLLYTFDGLAPNATTVPDLSHNGWAGQVGVRNVGSYASPTSPTFTAMVPEPASLALLALAGMGVLTRRGRR